jgi:hypothetical protein
MADGVDRRELLRKGLAAGTAAAALGAAGPLASAEARARRRRCPTPPAPPPDTRARDGLRDEGVGIYTDLSVANQLSAFTINPYMVSCAVGTLAAPIGTGSGPFAMLMYSLDIESFEVDRATSRLRATGSMRSITHLLGDAHEDYTHTFIAVASAHGGQGGRFDVHFVTPFWNPGNPMATRSQEIEGWSRFGGEVLLGSVNVAPD